MNLKDFLFGEHFPSHDWQAEPGWPLRLSFDDHALNGVRLGEPIGPLAPLGPAEDPDLARQGTLSYFSRGLELGLREDRLSELLLVFNPSRYESFLPWRSDCLYQGRPLALNEQTTEAELRALFGEPWWRDRDDYELRLFYEFGAFEWRFELSPEDRLVGVRLQTPPLLDDEGQRRMYHVERPWPAAEPGI